MIYNIGYAGRELEDFALQLKELNISYLIDIRSLPYSGYFPQYNREDFAEYLSHKNIKYVYMGDLLGPRSKDETHYKDNGQIDFRILSQSDKFREGIERLRKAEQYNVCLMCAEKAPEVCHRLLLVSRYAKQNGLDVNSIMFDGTIETLSETQTRIMKEKKLQPDFFTTKEELMEIVLDDQSNKFAYNKNK